MCYNKNMTQIDLVIISIKTIFYISKTISQFFVMIFDTLWESLGKNIPLLFMTGDKLIPMLTIIGTIYMLTKLAPVRKLDFVKSIVD